MWRSEAQRDRSCLSMPVVQSNAMLWAVNSCWIGNPIKGRVQHVSLCTWLLSGLSACTYGLRLCCCASRDVFLLCCEPCSCAAGRYRGGWGAGISVRADLLHLGCHDHCGGGSQHHARAFVTRQSWISNFVKQMSSAYQSQCSMHSIADR